jgi:plastocyanin
MFSTTGGPWTYTFDVPDNALGAWPFHDHTHHHDTKIDQGLFGGIVVLGPCDRPPRRFHFPWSVLRPIYLDVERLERLPVFAAAHVPERLEFDDETVLQLAPHIHARRLKAVTRQRIRQHRHGLEELTLRHLALPRPGVNTDHVPVFFHVLSNREAKPVFDSGDIEELGGEAEIVFDTAGDYPYFCRHHPEMTGTVHVVPGGPDPVTVTIVTGPPMAFAPASVTVGVGGTVKWINNSTFHHTVTSTQGAAMPTHCINGRGFVGNTPTIVGRSGQRIRWYVFNLDTSPTWHNFHPHAMRWKFGGEAIDIRSLGPAESFVVESEIPPVLLLTPEEEKAQQPQHRPADAKLHRLKGDFLFHCHVHHHMMNGMVGLVRARQSVWLTEEMAHQISHRTGLPLDDGSNTCPDVDPHPCAHAGGRWEGIAGDPAVAFMHAVLLPTTPRVLYWGYTRADQARVWDYTNPAGAYIHRHLVARWSRVHRRRRERRRGRGAVRNLRPTQCSRGLAHGTRDEAHPHVSLRLPPAGRREHPCGRRSKQRGGADIARTLLPRVLQHAATRDQRGTGHDQLRGQLRARYAEPGGRCGGGPPTRRRGHAWLQHVPTWDRACHCQYRRGQPHDRGAAAGEPRAARLVPALHPQLQRRALRGTMDTRDTVDHLRPLCHALPGQDGVERSCCGRAIVRCQLPDAAGETARRRPGARGDRCLRSAFRAHPRESPSLHETVVIVRSTPRGAVRPSTVGSNSPRAR